MTFQDSSNPPKGQDGNEAMLSLLSQCQEDCRDLHTGETPSTNGSWRSHLQTAEVD